MVCISWINWLSTVYLLFGFHWQLCFKSILCSLFFLGELWKLEALKRDKLYLPSSVHLETYTCHCDSEWDFYQNRAPNQIPVVREAISSSLLLINCFASYKSINCLSFYSWKLSPQPIIIGTGVAISASRPPLQVPGYFKSYCLIFKMLFLSGLAF